MANIAVQVNYIAKSNATGIATKWVVIPWNAGDLFDDKLAEITRDLEKENCAPYGENPLMVTSMHQSDSVSINGRSHSRIFDEVFPPAPPDWSKLPDYPAWSRLMADQPVCY